MPQETRTSDSLPAPDLTAEEVAQYLADHPEFLNAHPEILAKLTTPPTTRPDGVIDLQAHMMGRLRDESDSLRDEQRALISASRANQNTQNRVHAAILFLLDAESFEHLIQTINTDLSVLLDLDVARLLVESDGRPLPHAEQTGVRVVAEGFSDHYLENRDVRLQGDITGDEALFGAGAGLVRSQALVRLNVSTGAPPCLLALGSREPDMFHAGMRTELISFLARVLERCIRSWLNLPA